MAKNDTQQPEKRDEEESNLAAEYIFDGPGIDTMNQFDVPSDPSLYRNVNFLNSDEDERDILYDAE